MKILIQLIHMEMSSMFGNKILRNLQHYSKKVCNIQKKTTKIKGLRTGINNYHEEDEKDFASEHVDTGIRNNLNEIEEIKEQSNHLQEIEKFTFRLRISNLQKKPKSKRKAVSRF